MTVARAAAQALVSTRDSTVNRPERAHRRASPARRAGAAVTTSSSPAWPGSAAGGRRCTGDGRRRRTVFVGTEPRVEARRTARRASPWLYAAVPGRWSRDARRKTQLRSGHVASELVEPDRALPSDGRPPVAARRERAAGGDLRAVGHRRALELAEPEEPLHEHLEPVLDRRPGRTRCAGRRGSRAASRRRRVGPGVLGQERDLLGGKPWRSTWNSVKSCSA